MAAFDRSTDDFVHAPHMQYIHYIADMSEKQGCAEATNYNQSLNNTNMEY